MKSRGIVGEFHIACKVVAQLLASVLCWFLEKRCLNNFGTL